MKGLYSIPQPDRVCDLDFYCVSVQEKDRTMAAIHFGTLLRSLGFILDKSDTSIDTTVLSGMYPFTFEVLDFYRCAVMPTSPFEKKLLPKLSIILVEPMSSKTECERFFCQISGFDLSPCKAMFDGERLIIKKPRYLMERVCYCDSSRVIENFVCSEYFQQLSNARAEVVLDKFVLRLISRLFKYFSRGFEIKESYRQGANIAHASLPLLNRTIMSHWRSVLAKIHKILSKGKV